MMPTECASLLFARPRFALEMASAFLRLFFFFFFFFFLLLLLLSATMLHFRCFQHADTCSSSWSSKKAILPWHTVLRVKSLRYRRQYRDAHHHENPLPTNFFPVTCVRIAAKIAYYLRHVSLSTRTSVAPTGHSSLTVDMKDFYENMSRNSKFSQNRAVYMKT